MGTQWIDSAGGPLLCGSRLAAKHWRGTEGSSIGSEKSDYDRACQAFGYLSLAMCDSEEILILGDEPLQSAFIHSPQGLLIVRWISCLSPTLATSALTELPTSLPNLQEPLRFKIDTNLLMFDSAADGAKDLASVEVEAIPGCVWVTTQKYESIEHFEFLIHRFLL
jgi:hypothetical protein